MTRLQLTTTQLAGLAAGKCPDCSGQLLAGPCGGISQNVLCSICLEEFNIMGPFGVDRMGKNHSRAQQVYGVQALPLRVKLWIDKARAVVEPTPIRPKSFLRRLFSLTSG